MCELKSQSDMAGTEENFQRILDALDSWKCCGAPYLCGVSCQDDELSSALARAHRLVQDRINDG